MKQFLLTAVVIFLTGTMVYAQQTSSPPTSEQTRQEAQQVLNQGQSNVSQYESDLADLTKENSGNTDSAVYSKLKADIDKLDAQIIEERDRIKNNLDKGVRVSPEVLARLERLINQYKAKLAELEAFISG